MREATTVNLTIEQGEDWVFSFSYTDMDSVPIDMYGATASMMIRAHLDAAPVATLSTANGKISWTPVQGIFKLQLSAAETLKMVLNDNGIYDMFIKSTNGTVLKLITGDVLFLRAVTR